MIPPPPPNQIDKIIDRVEGKDSPAARRMLTRQLALLQSAADVCTAEANEINKYFKIWQQFTNSLLYAMTIRKGERDRSQWGCRAYIYILKPTPPCKTRRNCYGAK